MTYVEFLEVLTRMADISGDVVPLPAPDRDPAAAVSVDAASLTAPSSSATKLSLAQRLENLILSLISQFQTHYNEDMKRIEKDRNTAIKREIENKTCARAAQQVREAEERERIAQFERETQEAEQREREAQEQAEQEAHEEMKSTSRPSSRISARPATPLSPGTSVASIRADVAWSHHATMQHLAKQRHADAMKVRETEAKNKQREERRVKMEKEKEIEQELSGAAKARKERLERKAKHGMDQEAKQKQERERVRNKALRVAKQVTGETQPSHSQQHQYHRDLINSTNMTSPDRMTIQSDQYLH